MKKALVVLNQNNLSPFSYKPVRNELQKRGYSLTGLSSVSADSGLYHRESRHLDIMEPVIVLNKVRFNTDSAANSYLQDLLARFPDFDIGLILVSEKYMERRYPKGIRAIAGLLKNIEEFIDETDFDLVLDVFPGMAFQVALFHLLKLKKPHIPTLYFGASRLPGRIFCCCDPISSDKPHVSRQYHEFRKNGLPEKQRKEAEDFLNHFITYKVKGFGLRIPGQVKIKRNSFLNKISFLITNRFHFSFITLIKNKSLWLYNRVLWGLLGKGLFSKFDPTRPFIYFPLHNFPEASLQIRGKYFRNQYDLIEKLALAIPAGYTLYVKENPLNMEKLTPGFYRQILSRLPNISFVDLASDSHDLIKASKCVIAISGSAGYEGFFYGKPVLMFGSAFFSVFDNISSFQTLKNLRNQIASLISDFKPDNDNVLCGIAAMLAGFPKGWITASSSEVYPLSTTLNKENISAIVDYVDVCVKDFTPPK